MKVIKSEVKTFKIISNWINALKYLIYIFDKCSSLNFIFINKSWKIKFSTISTQNMKQQNDNNVDNKEKCWESNKL